MTKAALHPWNREFAWADHRALAGLLTQAQVDQFDHDGFVVLPQLLDSDERSRTVAEIDWLEAEAEAHLRSLPNQRFSIAEAGAITFTTHVVTRSPWLRQLSAHARILAICSDLVGPDVRLYWDQAVYKKPEKPRRFPWHQDNGYNFVEPQAYLTVWVALTDATLRNGCPQVARGLHRRGTLRHYFVDPLGFECFSEHDDPAVAEVPAGGAVVFSSLTPHLTGPNTTGEVRKAYILQYAPVGAAMLRGNPDKGDPLERLVCAEPTRQYQVLEGGRPVDPPPLAPEAAGPSVIRHG
ncbi:MAG TPA: phytanoyl-CoA dioxygenase family protein [Acidimicrobiales bacterium]|nr:phytanoyl-CoA dioxygenase family protein [Acidimicrobiales bacterium]